MAALVHFVRHARRIRKRPDAERLQPLGDCIEPRMPRCHVGTQHGVCLVSDRKFVHHAAFLLPRIAAGIEEPQRVLPVDAAVHELHLDATVAGEVPFACDADAGVGIGRIRLHGQQPVGERKQRAVLRGDSRRIGRCRVEQDNVAGFGNGHRSHFGLQEIVAKFASAVVRIDAVAERIAELAAEARPAVRLRLDPLP